MIVPSQIPKIKTVYLIVLWINLYYRKLTYLKNSNYLVNEECLQSST